MRRLLLVLMFAHALWPLAPAHAQGLDAQHVTDVVKVDGIIDRTVRDLIEARLEDTPDGGMLLLQINSPGTLGIDALALADTLANATVPVVVWVGPPGSLVQGSAVLLLQSATIAATSPGSGIGPGTPTDLGRVDDPARESIAARAAALAEEHGRDSEAVGALFEDGAEALAPQPSIDAGVAELAAPSVPVLLNELDGREVEAGGRTVELVTEGEPEVFGLRFSELGPVARVLHAVSSPSASYVLLVLGLWALVFELVQPGFGLAGVAGALFAALAIYSLTVLPTDWLGLGLILGGVGLYTADVKLRRLGLLSILGTVAFAFGSFRLYGDAAPTIDVAPWVIWTFVAGSAAFFGFALTAAIRAREQALVQHQSGLVGLVGEAVGDLAPEGQVVVKGAMWQGRSLSGPIPGGTRIRVRHVEGLVLEVSAEE